MKLATYSYDARVWVGAVVGDSVVAATGAVDGANSMLELLKAGQPALAALQTLIDSGKNRLPLAEVQLLAPVPRPGKFLGVGLNYLDHVGETGLEKPEYPTFFTKQSTCVIGTGAAIHCPAVSDKVDYEGELGIVIGRRCRNVSTDDAPSVIAGFTICNDVTVRDWQHRSPTWTLGKSFDTHGPMGPWIVTSDQIADPHRLGLKTWVDGELRQNANTAEMIFNGYELIAYLSQAMTLEPGDVITTGTPAGVGVKMKPRGYLKPGQTVQVEIEGIGKLVNPVIAEPQDYFVV